MSEAILMPAGADPRADIHKAIGSLDGVELFHNQVLAAIYIRPEKTKGGIILTQNTRGEDIYQSKVGLVVKVGPDAFKDPTGKWFNDVTLQEDDWIIFRPSDGWSITVNGVVCRILDDTLIRGKTDDPDRIW